MDAVERLPLPAAIVTKIMRSSGCSGGGGGGGVSNSFHQEKDDSCNVNGSKPAAWKKMSDDDIYRHAGQLTGLRNGEAFVEHDMVSVQEGKQSQRKTGKASRSNGSSGSRRSRATFMEGSLNVSGVGDVNDLPKELGSYPGKYNISDKTQTARPKTVVSGKRSEKRNGKIPKSKCDSFSVKAGLSSFSSAAGGNNILGVYGSKHDIRDFAKQVEEVALKELLDGSYKCPNSIKVKEKSTEALNGSILQSVREACSVLRLQKLTQTPKTPAVDATYNYNASSFLTNASTNDDNEGDATDPSPCNKVESSRTDPTDHHANILQFPLFKPKDVLDRLTLPPHKDLDLMLLDSMKPTSTSKVHNGGTLPTFPWSHVSGGHFKANPDVVKPAPSKSSCQGRWVKMGKPTSSLGDTDTDTDTTTYLANFQHLTYDQSLVPLQNQQPVSTEKEKSPLTISTFDQEVTPSGTRKTASKNLAEHSPGVLSAAQTLCSIAAEFRKQDQYGLASWQKKSSQKSIRASKLTSDEKLEKALFTIPSSRPLGPTNLINGPDGAKSHTSKKLKQLVNDPTKGLYHWSTSTPQSSRSSSSSSPSKSLKNKNSYMEAKHHESSSSPLKRSMTAPPAKLPNKPSKLRKLVPVEWKSRGDEKGNAK